MSITDTAPVAGLKTRRAGFSLPMPLWLIIVALAIGLAGSLNYTELVRTFSASYGKPLGDLTLILLPSFLLAACLKHQSLKGASRLAVAIAPITAAGMACPDTGYATLSSIANKRKLSVAFGGFAGFRLLFPAGPLIIATGLGFDGHALFLYGLALMIPVWMAGELWVRQRTRIADVENGSVGLQAHEATSLSWSDARPFMPLIVLGVLLILGGGINFSGYPLLDFISHPKGALFVAAALALVATDPESRRECIDTAMRRTGWLLIVCGAASALGGMISHFLSVEQILPATTSAAFVLVALFLITMVVKVVYGSSMATFATAAALLSPIVHASTISPAAAVFAICLGSFAIMPTDSYYWLVRTDALTDRSERFAVITMSGGATLQGVVGFAILLAMYVTGLV
jgi:GntP family gluconate:H+ symporter